MSVELGRNQKLIVTVARWRNMTCWHAFELLNSDEEREAVRGIVEAYYRSDECLDAVSALSETFGEFPTG